MPNPWPILLGRTLGLLLLAGLLGWFIGHVTPVLLIAALACLGWHLYHLYRLERWLNAGVPIRWPDTAPLQGSAIWKPLYRTVYRLQQRSRKRKRKLSRFLEQFQAAAFALPDAAVVLKDDDTVAWCNESARRLLGLRPPQDFGLRITTLVRHPSFVEFLTRRDYEDCVEFPSPVTDVVSLNVRVVPYGKKRRLLLAADVSRLHRLEQIRRDFVANVSHELRTPLTVINGYLETLLDSDDMDRWDLPLRRMQQQAGRMLHIIESLLMLSRLETQGETSPPQTVKTPDLLEAIVEDAVALSGEHGHHIHLEADHQLWIRGWERELRSAFSNLVYNAVRHTPDGSKITIRWYEDPRGAHLEVEDNGDGIPANHLPRITERFYRVDRGRQREKGGTGLGLAIVKHVMHHHDGQLNVISLVGVGSLFACDFQTTQIVRKPLPVADRATS
ncbi:MAG: phosphate regulon sensor histidine kinase PhoR [Gammaproteobacteria bacterium]|nr:phosphate regulon sensor histidine kinase PhoR [Gammaproteobacteria bacterium]